MSIRFKYLNVNSWGGSRRQCGRVIPYLTRVIGHARAGMYKDSHLARCTQSASARRQKMKSLHMLSQTNTVKSNLLCMTGGRQLSSGVRLPWMCLVWEMVKQLSSAQT